MITREIRDRSLFMGGRGPEIFGRGPLIFGKSLRGGGALIFEVKKFEKACETHFPTHFLRNFGEVATYFWQVAERGATYFWQVTEGGGHLFLAASKNKISGPPPAHK